MSNLVPQMRTAQWISLVIVAFLVLWLGVSWRYGWFPFAERSPAQSDTSQQRGDTTTATGPSTLSAAETAALIKATTATGPSTLSSDKEKVLIEATSAR